MAINCPKCNTSNPDTLKFCGECGAQLPSPKDIEVTETLETPKEELTTGSTFAGRYQIIEELGKGGMGRVYKALDKEINAKIALKLIKHEIASDKKTIERFRNELRVARDIAHKNVCRMYDLGKEGEAYYITMEYVSGEDLKSFIRRSGVISAGKAISIANQVCEGLIEAHRLGVVHRDLKPQNIMIDKEGNARIMDFGIARSLRAKGITGSGVMIGTPEYMSPEQVDGKEADQRADIYSLGVILYEMVTGRVPFDGDTPFSIGVKQKSEIPRPPREINEQIPDDLSQVILKCMEKEKEYRYQSVNELRSELMNLEKGIPTTERVEPKRKSLTSKEITLTFGFKKLLVPALIGILVVVVGIIIWNPWKQKESVPVFTEKPSIAVLPFEDLSPQKDQEYFCDGLAEELINRLVNIENLRVPARASAFSFKGKNYDIQEIGEKLKVETVLNGSVRKAGDKLRITAELVKTADGYPLWSKIYERNIEDTFALQDEISLAIVDRLQIKLFGKEKTKLVKHHTQNLEAYNLYLTGRFFWNKRTEEGFKKGIEYFKQAVEKDPNYALAYAGSADCYNLLGNYGYLPPEEAFPKAKEAAEKALSIDNTLAEAFASSAWVSMDYDWDWEEAEKKFRKAIELNPSYATAHQWYAHYLNYMGRHDEAIVEIKKAQELDPLSPIISVSKGYTLLLARLYDQAIEALHETLEMSPGFWKAHRDLGQSYLWKGMYEETIKEIKKARDLYGGWRSDCETLIGIAYVYLGKKEEAKQALDKLLELSKRDHVSPARISQLYFALKEDDQGFVWLENAYEDRSPMMKQIKIVPEFDRIRADPRFKAMLKKMNLE